MRIDLHTHSTISDGTDSPTRLMMKAAGSGLDVVALTDHDTFDGLEEAQAAGQRFGVRLLPGFEDDMSYRRPRRASARLRGPSRRSGIR